MGFQPLRPLKKALGLGLATLNGVGELIVATVNETRKGTMLVFHVAGKTGVRTGKVALGAGRTVVSIPVKVVKLGSSAVILLRALARSTYVAVIRSLSWSLHVTFGAAKLAVWPGLAYTVARTVAHKKKQVGSLTATFVALEYLMYILSKRGKKQRELKHLNGDTRTKCTSIRHSEESRGLDQHVTAEELGALIAMGWQGMEDMEVEPDGNSILHVSGNGSVNGISSPKGTQRDDSVLKAMPENVAAYGDGGTEGDSEERSAMVASIANRLVLYSTSVRAVRSTFEACNSVRQILQGYSVMLDERDLSMDLRFKNELKLLLRGKTVVPAVFVRGRFVGGLVEVQELDESNSLQPMLLGIKKTLSRKACVGCDGLRFVMCSTCDGSRKVRGESGFSECNDCNERGLQRCPFCV